MNQKCQKCDGSLMYMTCSKIDFHIVIGDEFFENNYTMLYYMCRSCEAIHSASDQEKALRYDDFMTKMVNKLREDEKVG